MDEYTRECLALKVDRGITSENVIDTLAELFAMRGVPRHIRSDNGPEFIAQTLRRWLKQVVLTAVENGGAGTVSRRSKMAAHNRAGLWAGRIGATAPITPPFRERHRSALRHGDVERDSP